MSRTPLSDVQLWTLLNRDRDTSLAQVARRFGCPESTVTMTPKRLRERGWVCTVSYGTCPVCGETYTRQGHRAGWKAYPPARRPRALKALNRGYDERRWREVDDVTRESVLTCAHAYTQHHQTESLQHATNRGRRWQAWEDDYIRVNPDVTTHEIARELGRTLYAVTDRRRKLRAQGRLE